MTVSKDEINVAILIAQSRGQDYIIPVLEAVRGERIKMLSVSAPHFHAKLDDLDGFDKPLLLIMADDDANTCLGPLAWACASAVIGWANTVMVNAAAGERIHYSVAVEAATLNGRCLLIETDSAHLLDWLEAVGKKAHFVVVTDPQHHPGSEVVH